ncbi:MAG: hypothetical protein ABL927_05770 [Bdellovibrionales bacterium]
MKSDISSAKMKSAICLVIFGYAFIFQTVAYASASDDNFSKNHSSNGIHATSIDKDACARILSQNNQPEKIDFVSRVNDGTYVAPGKQGDVHQNKITAQYLPEFDTVMLTPAHSESILASEDRKSVSVTASVDSETMILPEERENAIAPTPREQITKTPKYLALFAHGAGASYSSADAMRLPMRIFGENGATYKNNSILGAVRKSPNFKQGEVFAIDAPYHRYGAADQKLFELDFLTEYYALLIRKMKATQPGLPFFVFARSSSPMYFESIVMKYPDLIDAFVFISPTVPVIEWLKDSEVTLHQKQAEGKISLNEEGLKWSNHILSQTEWTPKSFSGKPVLVLSGGEDWEARPEEFEFFKTLVRDTKNVSWYLVQGAEHDMFKETSKNSRTDIIETVDHVEEFISKVISEKSLL